VSCGFVGLLDYGTEEVAKKINSIEYKGQQTHKTRVLNLEINKYFTHQNSNDRLRRVQSEDRTGTRPSQNPLLYEERVVEGESVIIITTNENEDSYYGILAEICFFKKKQENEKVYFLSREQFNEQHVAVENFEYDVYIKFLDVKKGEDGIIKVTEKVDCDSSIYKVHICDCIYVQCQVDHNDNYTRYLRQEDINHLIYHSLGIRPQTPTDLPEYYKILKCPNNLRIFYDELFSITTGVKKPSRKTRTRNQTTSSTQPQKKQKKAKKKKKRKKTKINKN
jgi:hypothetical protein